MENGFYKDKYFNQLDERLDTLEKKIDNLTTKVTYLYAWAGGVGTVAAFIINIIMK